MNRTEIASRLAERAGLDLHQARRVLTALFGSGAEGGLIGEVLERGEKVMIGGFGTFFVRERTARKIREPRTGNFREIPPTRVPSFRPGLPLRDRLR